MNSAGLPTAYEHGNRLTPPGSTVDPILVEIVQGTLASVEMEVETAIARTSRSPMIRDAHDFRAGIHDRQLRKLTGRSYSALVHPIVRDFPLAGMREGDVFFHNDVYESEGGIGHLPDLCVTVPVFHEGEVVAFVQAFGHHDDIGGAVPGSMPSNARTVFEEGLSVPPIKLWDAGVPNQAALRIMTRNSRMPDSLAADLDAECSACLMGARRLAELFARYGRDTIETAFDAILDATTETYRREILDKIPDGTYVWEDYAEHDGVDEPQLHTQRITLTKTSTGGPGPGDGGPKLLIDFTGTGPQAKGPINHCGDYVGGNFLKKWLAPILRNLADTPERMAELDVNEGVVPLIEMRFPEKGTLLTPIYPAPTNARTFVILRLLGVLAGVVAKAVDGRMPADQETIRYTGVYGKDRDGNDYLMREVLGGGSGGRYYADGEDTIHVVPDSRNLPTEFTESRFPFVVERLGLAVDSGGAGRHRGGLGYEKQIRMLRDASFMSIADRSILACWGVKGGKAGQLVRGDRRPRRAGRAGGRRARRRRAGAGRAGDPHPHHRRRRLGRPARAALRRGRARPEVGQGVVRRRAPRLRRRRVGRPGRAGRRRGGLRRAALGAGGGSGCATSRSSTAGRGTPRCPVVRPRPRSTGSEQVLARAAHRVRAAFRNRCQAARMSDLDTDPRPVLVVGATGKTGRAVAAALTARGVAVRAAVRPGRESGAPSGTTPVAVDLATGLGLEEALSGARAAYHLAPNMHPDEVGIAQRVAAAAVATGLDRLVFHSVLRPDDARMPHHRRKAEAEAVLRDALGDGVTVLRPAAYHQNLVGQAHAGLLQVPYSLDAPFTNVDLEDVAVVAADALCGEHAGDDPRPRRAGGAHDPAADRGGRGRAGAAGQRLADAAGGLGGGAGRLVGRPGAGRPAGDVRGVRRGRAGGRPHGAACVARASVDDVGDPGVAGRGGLLSRGTVAAAGEARGDAGCGPAAGRETPARKSCRRPIGCSPWASNFQSCSPGGEQRSSVARL